MTITISVEDFPLYKLLDKLNQPGCEAMRADFSKATSPLATNEDVYQFVLGIQTISRNVPPHAITGCNKDMMDKTTASAYATFKKLSAEGHPNAAIVCQEYEALGISTTAYSTRGR